MTKIKTSQIHPVDPIPNGPLVHLNQNLNIDPHIQPQPPSVRPTDPVEPPDQTIVPPIDPGERPQPPIVNLNQPHPTQPDPTTLT